MTRSIQIVGEEDDKKKNKTTGAYKVAKIQQKRGDGEPYVLVLSEPLPCIWVFLFQINWPAGDHYSSR